MENKVKSIEEDSRLNWYLDSKFGLFIHWGAYTIAGAEASWSIMAPRLSEAMFSTPSEISESDYIELPKKFNPVDFNADEWVKAAKDAGMRYIVFTSKHHDGFCMFDAPNTDYKITNTPFARDICLELATACKKADMRLGFYYSPPDMHHPGYRDTSKPSTKNWLGEPNRKEWADYLDYMESHLRKLLTDYGDISVIWFDGLCNHAKYDTPRFHKLIHELSPNTLINDRLGDDYDFVTPEQFIPNKGIPIKNGLPPSGDGMESEKFFRVVLKLFKIPLIRIWIRKQMHRYAEGTLDLAPLSQENYPSPERFQPWETCMTMGQSWAYNPNETEWKSTDTLIKSLSAVVGHGGNFLLNIGPTDRGVFPQKAIDRLKGIGKWMDTNSKAIYGNTYTPLNNMSWCSSTRKGNRIFLHMFTYPNSGKLIIDNFPSKVLDVTLLNGKKLDFTQKESLLEISIQEKLAIENVEIVTITIEDIKEELVEYTRPQLTGKSPKEYIRSNAIVSALINGIANGLIAFFSYRLLTIITAKDAGIDILITVGIISFFTSWLVVSGCRKDIKKGKVAYALDKDEINKRQMHSSLYALLIMLFCVIVFGGILFGFVHLLLPNGFSNWGYILFKTLYTSFTGALTVVLSIKSVFRKNRQNL